MFVMLLMVPVAAQAGKSKCSNKNAMVINTNSTYTGRVGAHMQDHWICAHKTAQYGVKTNCTSGYKLESGTCKDYKAKKKSCKFGQKLCSNSYCVASLKKCKSSNKKGSPSSTCTGTGWKSSGSQCVRTKTPTDNKCPVGWFKAKFGPSSGKLYCKTSA